MHLAVLLASLAELDPLETFFAALDPAAAVAYLLIIVDAPDGATPLVELGRMTSLPLLPAHDGAAPSPGVVLVAPAAHELIVADGVLRLWPTRPADLDAPLDTTLTSVAGSFGPRAVVVALAGRGDDGLRGALSVRRAGGRVLARADPSSALPQALARAGLCERVDEPGALARTLAPPDRDATDDLELAPRALAAAGVGAFVLDSVGRLRRVLGSGAAYLHSTDPGGSPRLDELVAVPLRPALAAVLTAPGSRHTLVFEGRAVTCASSRLAGPELLVTITPGESLAAPVLADAHDRLLDQLLDAVPGHTVLLDERGWIERCNTRWTQFARDNGGDLARLGAGTDYLAASAANPDVARGVREVLDGTRPRYECTYPCHSPTEERWYYLRAERCSTAPVRVLVVHDDITRERQRERVVQDMRQARAVAESQRQFLAVLSHEIRSPMTAVSGLTDLLVRLDPADAQRPLLTDLKRSCAALDAVLRDVLDFAALDDGSARFEVERLDLSELVRDVAAALSPRLDPTRVRLLTRCPSRLRVLAPEARLRQILTKFADNAARFTERGTITLSAALGGTTDAPTLRLSVVDSGPGVADSRKRAIFRPFAQGSQRDGRPRGGTGLGLAIVAEIARRMGGRAWVEDAPTPGAAFHAELPVSLADPPPAAAPPARERLAALRLLVVEDDPLIQLVLTRLLTLEGHSVVVASDLAAGRQALSAGTYDAVILDKGLPDGDGVDLARELQQRRSDAPAPFLIAASAAVRPADRAEFVGAGVDAFLDKPFDELGLHAVLRRAAARLAEAH